MPTDTAFPAEQTDQEPQAAAQSSAAQSSAAQSSAAQSSPAQPETAERRPALILRNDTILGVCEAIGQDFGFHANWLRIPLAGGVLISPIAAFGIYFALGLAVLLSRLIYPAPRQLAAPHAAAQPRVRPVSTQGADNQTNEELLAA